MLWSLENVFDHSFSLKLLGQVQISIAVGDFLKNFNAKTSCKVIFEIARAASVLSTLKTPFLLVSATVKFMVSQKTFTP